MTCSCGQWVRAKIPTTVDALQPELDLLIFKIIESINYVKKISKLWLIFCYYDSQ